MSTLAERYATHVTNCLSGFVPRHLGNVCLAPLYLCALMPWLRIIILRLIDALIDLGLIKLGGSKTRLSFVTKVSMCRCVLVAVICRGTVFHLWL